MEKTDRRIKRTNRLLQQALIDLTLEKGFDTVTIRDLTERADIGYATFFRHFPDKEALLEEVLRSMKEDFQKLLAPHWMISDPENGCTLLFQYVQGNLELVKVLLNTTSSMALLKPIQEIGLQEVMGIFNRPGEHAIPVDLAAGYLLSSLIMMVRWWVEHDQPYLPEEMGRFTAELIIRPLMERMAGGRRQA